MKNKKKAIAYVRKATSEQNQQAPSLQRQLETLVKYAQRCQLEIVEVFEYIGNTSEQLLSALDYCQKNEEVKYLLVASPDRISRDYNELWHWQLTFSNNGVCVQTPMPTNDQRMLIHNLIRFAKYEQDMRSLRAKRDLQHRILAVKK